MTTSSSRDLPGSRALPDAATSAHTERLAPLQGRPAGLSWPPITRCLPAYPRTRLSVDLVAGIIHEGIASAGPTDLSPSRDFGELRCAS
jgi:hypothetical protein